MDRRYLWIALGALILVGAALFGLSLTRDKDPEPSRSGAEAPPPPVQGPDTACASSAAYERLKRLVFREAARAGHSDPANFDTLATNSVVRMENPVVESRDEALGITTCAGRFVIELPPGAERGFGGERRLIADVRYTAQAAADGSGLVYRLSGAEPIISRLAGFDLGRQAPPIALPPPPQQVEPQLPSPVPAEREGGIDARPAPEPVRAAPRPSFSCAAARTRSERMVCSSGALAASDRAMASLYHSALADADGRQRRALTRTRDRFLAYRERCPNEACIAEAYQGRMMEIRDIMAGRF